MAFSLIAWDKRFIKHRLRPGLFWRVKVKILFWLCLYIWVRVGGGEMGEMFVLVSVFSNVRICYFFFVLYDSKFNIFRFQTVGWTKQASWRQPPGLEVVNYIFTPIVILT